VIMKLNNKYYILRHGQAISNVKDIVSCWPEKFKNPLTKRGIAQAKKAAKILKDKNIGVIFVSPLLRTTLTAEIIGKVLRIKPKIDKRLREQQSGVFNGRPFEELKVFFGEKGLRRFKIRPKTGETYIEIKKRMLDFLKDTDKRYKGKNILIVSHELPILFLEATVRGVSDKDFYSKKINIGNGEFVELN
jgi:broad specificity phosphatase PhoE